MVITALVPKIRTTLNIYTNIKPFEKVKLKTDPTPDKISVSLSESTPTYLGYNPIPLLS